MNPREAAADLKSQDYPPQLGNSFSKREVVPKTGFIGNSQEPGKLACAIRYKLFCGEYRANLASVASIKKMGFVSPTWRFQNGSSDRRLSARAII
jgi:hypothetical protein